MRIRRSRICLSAIQIKSLEKAKVMAAALNTLEEECGIHEVEIRIEDVFICPWVDLDKLNATPMEKLLSGLLKRLRAKQRRK